MESMRVMQLSKILFLFAAYALLVSCPFMQRYLPDELPAPVLLSIRPLAENQLELSWDSDYNSATSITIQRKDSESAFKSIGSVEGSATSYSDSGLAFPNTYSYRVFAMRDSVQSDYSNVLAATVSKRISDIKFSDENLAIAAQEHSAVFAHQVDHINCSGISSLDGLEELLWIEFISINGSTFTDLSPISCLHGLRLLYLTYGQFSDTSALNGLTNLEILQLCSSQLTSFSSVESLPSLREISIYKSPVNDISSVGNQEALRELYISECNLLDLSPLSASAVLESLTITGTPLSDISPLSGQNALIELCLEANSIVDVTPISNLANLEELRISHNNINSGVRSLANLPRIITITISDNPIAAEDIAFLRDNLPETFITF